MVSTDGAAAEETLHRGSGNVRAVDRTFEILGLFSHDHPAWTAPEIAASLGLPRTTVIRLVATLAARDVLWQRQDKTIVLGPAFLRWTSLAADVWHIRPDILDVVSELVERCGETASIWIRQNLSRVCVAECQSTRPLRHIVHVGDQLPVWGGASSRILLSDADDQLIRKAAGQIDRGPGYASELIASIRAARDEGVAISHGERQTGLSSVSAPILDRNGRLAAALSMAGATERFDPPHLAEFSIAVRGAAQRISALGFEVHNVGWGLFE
jgi:DNA-binding IclR family transcriptional regulator